jgi:predicted nucleotide-binding protein
MRDAQAKLSALLSDADDFTFENFSTKGAHGYPEAYSPEWLAWRTRVRNLIRLLFGAESAPLNTLAAGDRVSVLRNESDRFELAKSYYKGALRTAIQIVEKDTFGELRGQSIAPVSFSNRVFVVHGHNDSAKSELEVLLTSLGLEPVVLHRQPDLGLTVIEKFEQNSDLGFVFVLLTPDEVAYLRSQDALPDEKRVKEWRARPNVIFEFGYFVGRLGRSRVCCLHTGGVALPSDLAGLVYKSFSSRVEEVGYAIIRELKAAGYTIDLAGAV